MVPGATDADNRQLKLSFGGNKPVQSGGAGGETPLKVVSFQPVVNFKGPGGELQSPSAYYQSQMGGQGGLNMTSAKAGPFTTSLGAPNLVQNRNGPTVARNFQSGCNSNRNSRACWR